jgi:hypothetical protein
LAGQQRQENVVNGILYEFVVYQEPVDEGSMIDESPSDLINTHAHSCLPGTGLHTGMMLTFSLPSTVQKSRNGVFTRRAHGWLDVPHERIEPCVPGYGQHVPFSSIA